MVLKGYRNLAGRFQLFVEANKKLRYSIMNIKISQSYVLNQIGTIDYRPDDPRIVPGGSWTDARVVSFMITFYCL